MLKSMHGGNIAIVGAAETDQIGVLPNTSVYELHANSAVRALADAGLTVADVDGFATTMPNALEVADYIGIRPTWLDGTMVGGCSYMLHVRHAAAAIASGAAHVVLITHGESGRSRVGMPPMLRNPSSPGGQFEQPFGALAPFASFTTPVMSFLESRGLTRRDMAEVVATQREWAIPNERAFRRKPITVDEILEDKPLSYPFTKDMICVVTDGGGALVLVSAERAKDMNLAKPAVYLMGSGEATESPIVSQMDDLNSFGAFRSSSKHVFESAGMTPDDMDHAMFYDAFAHLPLYMLEDCGFVGRGESGAFYAEGHSRPGGRLPINTTGGGLSYTHSGMYGMFAIQEAVRQLRGDAVVQVPNLKTSFVQGVGMMFAASGSLVLSNQAG